MRHDEINTPRARAREEQEAWYQIHEQQILELGKILSRKFDTMDKAALEGVVHLLSPVVQGTVHASEDMSDYRQQVRRQVQIHFMERVHDGKSKTDPVVQAIVPEQSKLYKGLIEDSVKFRTLHEEKTKALHIMQNFVAKSVSASFDFTQEYAKLQKAYQMLNAKVRYVTIEEAIQEGPCMGVDVRAPKVAMR